jgi:hypothetical protein
MGCADKLGQGRLHDITSINENVDFRNGGAF